MRRPHRWQTQHNRDIRMIRNFALPCFALCALALTTASASDGAAGFPYPATQRIDHSDVYHGVRVEDPYRWLEDTGSDATKKWVESENALSQPYLEAIPAREKIKQRLTQLWNYERYDLPVKRGGHYFYTRNDGLQNQSVLYVADGLHSEPRVLL